MPPFGAAHARVRKLGTEKLVESRVSAVRQRELHQHSQSPTATFHPQSHIQCRAHRLCQLMSFRP